MYRDKWPDIDEGVNEKAKKYGLSPVFVYTIEQLIEEGLNRKKTSPADKKSGKCDVLLLSKDKKEGKNDHTNNN